MANKDLILNIKLQWLLIYFDFKRGYISQKARGVWRGFVYVFSFLEEQHLSLGPFLQEHWHCWLQAQLSPHFEDEHWQSGD